jgi:small subunit ribosomal protein S3
MGQKTNPIGARLGIIRGWESNWYGNKKDFAAKLIEDNKIRNYRMRVLTKAVFQRSLSSVRSIS